MACATGKCSCGHDHGDQHGHQQEPQQQGRAGGDCCGGHAVTTTPRTPNTNRTMTESPPTDATAVGN
jgi:hypothetical protein